MTLSGHAVDTFISQGLARLTECRAAPIDQFDGHEAWLEWFILKSIVAFQLPQDKAALAHAVIRRADAALEAYAEGRSALDSFVSKERRIRLYFRAVRKFESVVANVHQAAEFLRNTGLGVVPRYSTRDGSPHDRLNALQRLPAHNTARPPPRDVD